MKARPVYDGRHRDTRWRDREQFQPGIARCRRCGKAALAEGITERELFVGYHGHEAVHLVLTTGCHSCAADAGPSQPARGPLANLLQALLGVKF